MSHITSTSFQVLFCSRSWATARFFLEVPQKLSFRLCLMYLKRLKEIDPSMPAGKHAKYTKFLPRWNAALLIQLRSGHIPLNMYLHRIGKIDSPLCQECRKNETVFHYLIECRWHSTEENNEDKVEERCTIPQSTTIESASHTNTIQIYYGNGKVQQDKKGLGIL